MFSARISAEVRKVAKTSAEVIGAEQVDGRGLRTWWCAAAMMVAAPVVLGGSVFPTTVEPAVIRSGGTAFGSHGATQVSRSAAGYVKTQVGCMSDLSATTMNAELRHRIGPLIGWDNPHVIPLGRGRRLWILHDSYMDHGFRADSLDDAMPQIQNLAVVQRGRCFTMFHRGTTRNPENFESGRRANPPLTYYWPLGGQRFGDRVKIFWAKMKRSDVPRGRLDGITRHPVATWIGEYDAETLASLRFYRSPYSSVTEPPGVSDFIVQYGFAIDSSKQHTYLFGNPNMLNLAMNGGHANGPHPATRTYVARVPRGRLRVDPEYRTATGWSDDPDDAVPISERFWTENTMQPRRFGNGQWVSVAKEDGFFGNELVIDVAHRPWGPWRTAARFPMATRYGSDLQNSYAPVLLDWRDPSGNLMVVVPQNAWIWREAIEHPAYYRPKVVRIAWPFDT